MGCRWEKQFLLKSGGGFFCVVNAHQFNETEYRRQMDGGDFEQRSRKQHQSIKLHKLCWSEINQNQIYKGEKVLSHTHSPFMLSVFTYTDISFISLTVYLVNPSS